MTPRPVRIATDDRGEFVVRCAEGGGILYAAPVRLWCEIWCRNHGCAEIEAGPAVAKTLAPPL